MQNNLLIKQIVMKLFLVLSGLFIGSSMLLAEGSYSQNIRKEKIDLDFENIRIDKVLEILNKKTDFNFLYNEKEIRSLGKDVTLSGRSFENAEMVLEEIARQTGLVFRCIDENISVKVVSSSKDARHLEKAAGKKISGEIVDAKTQEPLVGATIQIKGTTHGTITDSNGHFELVIPDDSKELKISFIGYQVMAVVAKPSMTIQLMPDIQSMDEIVVTGQGDNVSKKRLSNNVKTIKANEIEQIPSQRIDQLLSAQLPNAQLNLTGGQAGATSIIRARGVNSAFLNSTPVIYVDGVRMDNLNTHSSLGGGSAQGAGVSSIADIPMDNIEKIEYINGGAATTLYGSDAANGVIQIFTKKGSRNSSVTFEVKNGIETPTADFLYFKKSKDLLFQNGYYQKYHLGFDGRSKDGFGYSFSGNYLNSPGAQLNNQNKNEKIDFSSGFRAKLGEKVSYESSFIFVHNEYNRNRNGNQGGYTGLWFAESGASRLKGFNNRLDDLSEDEYREIKAFVNEGERLQNNKIRVNRFTVSQAFRYHPLENLRIKLNGGIDYRDQNDKDIQTNEYLSHTSQTKVTDEGNIENVNRKYFGITLELNAQHTWKTQSFSFITTVGGQLFRTRDHQISYSGTDIRDGAKTISDAAVKSSDEYLSEVLNYGLYIQENIGYRDCLFLDMGLRGDRNPSFGDHIGTQYYPKIGFSWLPGIEKVAPEIVSSFRLRAGYGVSGNLPPAFANDKTISFTGFNNEQAAYFGQPGNDNLKPEKTHTYEAGTDLSLWNDRFVLSAGYYFSTTKEALFYVPSTPSFGYTEDQLQNVGKIRNRGWEFNMTVVPVMKQNLSLSFNASLNTLYNKVIDSGGVAAFNINGFSARTIQTVVQEGYPIGFLRGNYGTFDENGVLENTTAQSYLGNTIPDLFGNMSLNFIYRNFSFFANASYQAGAYADDFDAQFRFYYDASDDHIPAGEIAENGRANWLKFTNMFVQKTDFIKVRTMGLSYRFRPKNSSFLKSFTAGFTVTNPFNFAASSFDPENTISGAATGQGGATTGGISYATYSAPRQYITTLRFNF